MLFPCSLLSVTIENLSHFDATIAVIIGSIVAIKNFRFQSVHTKRLQVIEEAYEKVKSASRSFKSLTDPFQGAGDLPKAEKIKEFANKANEMVIFLDNKKLFFDSKERNLVDLILAKFTETWHQFIEREIIDKDPQMAREKIRVWQKVWNSADKDIPLLISLLEEEFQKKLGLK